MNIRELVASAKATVPTAFKGLQDRHVMRVVTAALNEIKAQIDKTAEGPVQIPGLGRFVVKRVQPTAATTGSPAASRRVIFRSAPKKSGAAAK